MKTWAIFVSDKLTCLVDADRMVIELGRLFFYRGEELVSAYNQWTSCVPQDRGDAERYQHLRSLIEWNLNTATFRISMPRAPVGKEGSDDDQFDAAVDYSMAQFGTRVTK